MASWSRIFGPSQTEEKVPEISLNNRMDGWGDKKRASLKEDAKAALIHQEMGARPERSEQVVVPPFY
jgi:hypothetical protein